MALLVRVDRNGETIMRVGFPTSPIRVGRNSLNELSIDDPVVSQWHASIKFDEKQGQVEYVDFGSTNGTVLNNTLLQAHTPAIVNRGDVLIIGGIKIFVVFARISPELLDQQDKQNLGATRAAGSSASIQVVRGEAEATQVFSAAKKPDIRPTMVYIPPSDKTKVENSSFQEAFQQMDQAIDRTRPAFKAYRKAWEDLLIQLRVRLNEAPDDLKSHIANGLSREFPQINREEEFKELLREHRTELAVGEDVDVGQWLHTLKFGPGSDQPREFINNSIAMERVGALIEAFAEAFVSMRRGYEQFGEDMALKVTREESPLTAAQTYRDVIRELLNWNADGDEMIIQLKRAFADLAVHQVALLHGFVAGVRDLFYQVGPEALSSGQSSVVPKQAKNGGFVLGRKGRLWKLYERVHHSLTEEDRFTRLVFGKKFARAYFNLIGGQIQQQEPRGSTYSQVQNQGQMGSTYGSTYGQ